MGSDFSALDAELDTLGAGPVVDALALAATYAGNLAALSDIDAALSTLDSDRSSALLDARYRDRAPDEASAGLPNFLAGDLGRAGCSDGRARATKAKRSCCPTQFSVRAPSARTSTQREKADAVGRNATRRAALHAAARSRSTALGSCPATATTPMETDEEELVEADVDLMDLRTESAPMLGMPPRRVHRRCST